MKFTGQLTAYEASLVGLGILLHSVFKIFQLLVTGQAAFKAFGVPPSTGYLFPTVSTSISTVLFLHQ